MLVLNNTAFFFDLFFEFVLNFFGLFFIFPFPILIEAPGPKGGNGVQNNINTRQKLLKYDPKLLTLFTDYFHAPIGSQFGVQFWPPPTPQKNIPTSLTMRLLIMVTEKTADSQKLSNLSHMALWNLLIRKLRLEFHFDVSVLSIKNNGLSQN